jgi:nucleotide-binding universal stress UspA family protein
MATHPLPALSGIPAPVPHEVPVRIPHVDRILVPIDFSEASTAAFLRALDIAKIYNSSLVLLHVMTHQTSNGMANILPGALLKLELDLQADLQHLGDLARDHGISCSTILRKGPILEHVRDLLHHQSIDLLVLATHGGRGIRGVFLGSTAERLIRHVTIPVLTVGSACNQPDWSERGARHILFAGDFCPETLCGLSLALGIRQTTGARLAVVQAVPPRTASDKVQAIRQHIESLVPPGTDIHTPAGPIGGTVCALARELDASLISLGVHKHSFARELFGTALLEILLNAPCPVLSVRQCD